MIDISDFQKVDMRVGTIVEAGINKGVRKPAYKLKIDLGDELGFKYSSAQITNLYTPEELVGKQIIAVVNFPAIKIADVKSEVLVLGLENKDGVILLTPDKNAVNGSKVY